MSDGREKRDLVLAPGTYAYMQDVTTGAVKTFVGPCVINQTAQEVPVVYVADEGRFARCGALEEAVTTRLEMARADRAAAKARAVEWSTRRVEVSGRAMSSCWLS